MRRLLFAPLLLSLSLAYGALACEPPPMTTASGAPEPAIASVYRSRCGGCHMRIDPGTRTREQLERAFERHRTRLRLREDQWRDLVSYLAVPDAPAPPAAPVPCLPAPESSATVVVPTPDEKSSP